MSWASHPTDQMPEAFTGRHRRRPPKNMAAISVVVALVLLVAAAVLAPMLLGGADATAIPASALTDTPTSDASTAGPTPSAVPVALAGTPKAPVTPKTTPSTVATPAATAAPFAALAEAVLNLTNAERIKQGCVALHVDAKLAAAAQAHTTDMAFRQELSHTGADGSDPAARLRTAGYSTTAGWAENVAAGYPTPEAVMTGWMNSTDHRTNILNCSLKAIGVGVARAANDQLYWTQDFGGR